MKCENCEKEHNRSYGSGRFCTAFCARSFSSKENRVERNKKISSSLTGKGHPKIKRVCPICEKEYLQDWKYRSLKTCSQVCGFKWKYSCHNPNREAVMIQHRENGLKSAAIQSKLRRSKNEILFFELCKEVYEDAVPNHAIFNGWDADVVIPSIKMAIMWNGPWHYKKITKKHSVKQVQNRDRIKLNEIKTHGYESYVIRDNGSHNPLFVREQFQKFIDSLKENIK